MGTVTNTLTHLTAPVNFNLMRGLLRAAERNFPYYNGVLPGTLANNQGTFSVKWERLDNLSAATTPLTELSGDQTALQLGRTAATPTYTNITATAQKYGNFINTSEEVDLMQVNTRSVGLFDKLGENAGHSLNLLMRDIFDGAANVRRAGGVTADTTIAAAITVNDIRAMVNTLDRNSGMKFFSQATGADVVDNKTVRHSYMGICHVDQENDVRDISGFVAVEQYAGYTSTFQNEFGAVEGVRWCSTEIAPVSTGAGTTTATGLRGASDAANDIYSYYIYGREAVGSLGLGTKHAEEIYKGISQNPDRIPAVIAIQHPPGSAGAADPYNELGSLAWKAWWAGARLNEGWLIKGRAAATDYAL